METLKMWILAARPATLWASVAPVIMGTAMAYEDGLFHGPSALVALLAALLIQIGTNFVNDYYDFAKGADTDERTGPLSAIQEGWVTPQTMQKAFIVVFAMATLLGCYLVFRGGWIILLIGIACIVSGFLYTATPFATAYTGFGDLFVLIFFGPVAVGGTYYVQGLTLTVPVVIAGLAPGFLSTAILTVNNLRDRVQDQKAHKNTLVVRFGKKFAQIEYLLSLFCACCIPIFLYFYTGTHFFAMAALLSMIVAIPAIKSVFTFTENASLNITLATTGKVLLVFSLVFSAGWVL